MFIHRIWVDMFQQVVKIAISKQVFTMSKQRGSRPDMFCKKGVLRNFVKFTGKHLCQNLFFNTAVGLRLAWHRCFPVNFAKFLRTPFIIEHLWWLLLNKSKERFSKILFRLKIQKEIFLKDRKFY